MKRKSLIIFLAMLVSLLPPVCAQTTDGREYNLDFTKNADTIATLDCTDTDGNAYAQNVENWFGGIEESYGSGLYGGFGGLSADILKDSETQSFTAYYLSDDGETLTSDAQTVYKMDFCKEGYAVNTEDSYILSTARMSDGTTPSSLETRLNAVPTESVRFAVSIRAANRIKAAITYTDGTSDEAEISTTGWATMSNGANNIKKYFNKRSDGAKLKIVGKWSNGYRLVVPYGDSGALVKEPNTVSKNNKNITFGVVLYEMSANAAKIPEKIVLSVSDKYPVVLYSMKQCEIKNETLAAKIEEAESIIKEDRVAADNIDTLLCACEYADILEERGYVHDFSALRSFAYTAEPENGTKNLYNVNEISFNWKDLFDISALDITVKCGDEVLSGYTLETEGAQMKIKFENTLEGGKNYTVSFGGVTDTSGNFVPVPDYKIQTGGVYKGIEVSAAETNLPVGGSVRLAVYGIEESGSRTEISAGDAVFTSDNPEVISVSADGTATAHKKGSAVIKAEFEDKVPSNPNADENNKFYAYITLEAYSPITEITGSREDTTIYFGDDVTPQEVYFTDTETTEKIHAGFTYKDKVLYVVPEKLLDLTQKYFLTIRCEERTYSKTVSFETLMSEDFETADAYKRFTQNRWSGDKNGKKFNDINAENAKGNLVLGQGKAVGNGEATLGYAVDAESRNWKDYTVEFKYLTKESGYAAKDFVFYMLSQNTSQMCVIYDVKQAVTIGTGETYTRYRDNAQVLHTIENAEPEYADKTKFAENDLLVSGSMMGKDLSMRARTADSGELVYLKKTKLPVEPDTLYQTSGSFGIYASAVGAAETDVFYIDDVVCYKTNYGDEEYTASILYNARDLYNVTDVKFYWNVSTSDISKSNITITEDGTPYTDFDVVHSDNTTEIIFANPLEGEKQWKIAFEAVKDRDGGDILPAPLTFFTGGVYKIIKLSDNRFLQAGKNTEIYLEGTTEKDGVYKLVNDYISYSADKEVFEINADGILKAKDRGYAMLKAVYLDPNTDNTNGDGGSNVFTVEMPVYSYVSKENMNVEEEYKKAADLTFENGALKICGTDLKIGIGSKTLAELTGYHSVEILKIKDKFEIYTDGIKTVMNTEKTELYLSAADCTQAELYNLIGSKCTAEFVNVRLDSKGIKCEYAYEDKDGDEESGTVISWYASENENGGYTKVSGQNDRYFTAAGYEGMYLKAEVLPKNKYEEGTAVRSEKAYFVSKNTQQGGGSSGGGGSRSGGSGISVGGSAAEGVQNNIIAVVYKDVNSTHWAFKAISELTESGVLKGFADGTFLPEKPVTRAEFICAVLRLKKEGTAEYTGVFGDVAEDDWFAPFVQKAYDKKYIAGDGENFNPNAEITREEAAVILARAFKISGKGETAFNDDESISDWARDAVAALANHGILNGTGNGMFEPKSSTTRAQTAVILSRLAD